MLSWLLFLTMLASGFTEHVAQDDNPCSLEQLGIAAMGGTDLPICRQILKSMSRAHRKQLDGSLVMKQADRHGAPCTLRWFNPADACNILTKVAPTTVIFLGDSITRHFMHGLQLLVRGQMELGALREDLPANVTENCSCNRQFTVKACREWIIKDTNDLSVAQHPCPGARVVFFGATTQAEVNISHVAEFAAQQPRSLVVLGGWGLHNGLLAKPIYQSLVKELWDQVQQQPHVKMLCLSIHSVQSNVPQQYQRTQNNRKVNDYNNLLHRLCRSQGIPFFDTFAMTSNVTSFDGLHYGQGVNILKAQLLMNYISELDADMAWLSRNGIP